MVIGTLYNWKVVYLSRLNPSCSERVASGDATCFDNRANEPGVPGAALCAPIFKHEVIIGLLYADRVESPAKPFNQSDAEFAEQVGQTLGHLAQ